MSKVDWEFIASLESKGATEGYVPDKDKSNSGVTIATGFDLGQHSIRELEAWTMRPDLVERFKPYIGLKGPKADEVAKNLKISDEEAVYIDKIVKAKKLQAAREAYDRSIKAGAKTFDQLFGEAQTVIASVSFQYGSLSKKAPKFWKTIIEQDWVAAIHELRNFGDRHAKRRKKEAALLERGWRRQKQMSEMDLGLSNAAPRRDKALEVPSMRDPVDSLGSRRIVTP